jgi:hypothetical protein
VVYSVGSSVKVTGETLCCDRVRDRPRTWVIQSGSHKAVTETGITPGSSHAKQGNLYPPANVIAIRRDRVILHSILENEVNYRYSAENAELPLPGKHYEILD